MFRKPFMGIGHTEFAMLTMAGYGPKPGPLSPTAKVIYSKLTISDLPELQETAPPAALVTLASVDRDQWRSAVRQALEAAMFEFEESRVW